MNRIFGEFVRNFLDLKDAIENLRGNMHLKYMGFLRISEDVIEVEQVLIELQKHVYVQGILVQDLMSSVCREFEIWNKCQNEDTDAKSDLEFSETDEILNYVMEDPKVTLLETLDILLVEHKIEEVLLILDTKEKDNLGLGNSEENLSNECSSYKEAFLKRKDILKNLLVGICEHPFVRIADLKKALSGLVKLRKVSLAHQLLLKAYGYGLQEKKIEDLLPSCSIYTNTFAATLSQFFSWQKNQFHYLETCLEYKSIYTMG